MSLAETVKIKGRIESISRSAIRVVVEDFKGCQDCGVCAGPGGRRVDVPLREGFLKGEKVDLVIPCSMLSGISFLIYFIPVVALLAGFTAGYFAGGNLVAAAGGLAALTGSYMIIKPVVRGRYKNIIEISHAGN